VSGPANTERKFCSWKCFIAYGQKMETLRKKKVAEARAAREDAMDAGPDGLGARMAREHKQRMEKQSHDGSSSITCPAAAPPSPGVLSRSSPVERKG